MEEGVRRVSEKGMRISGVANIGLQQEPASFSLIFNFLLLGVLQEWNM
jgi:hypothetical protein